MPIQIRPFNEESESSDPATSEASQDTRAATYMESLRSRITDQDETQRKTWLKKVKPAAIHKPLPPARPDWMNEPEAPKAESKSSAKTTRPFGSPKKRAPKP